MLFYSASNIFLKEEGRFKMNLYADFRKCSMGEGDEILERGCILMDFFGEIYYQYDLSTLHEIPG